MKALVVILTFLTSLFFSGVKAQDQPSPIIFIYDASGSMWGQIDGKTKMEIASQVLSETIEELPDQQAIGLVAYGHRNKTDCRDVEFVVATQQGSKSQVNTALGNIKPLGKTPLAYSAELVIGKLRESKEKATVILVTDGIESCDGDLCKVVQSAKAEGIDFKMHIVGFGLKEEETAPLICAAKAGDGQYYDADNAEGLSEVLQEVTKETVDKPDGNFTVSAYKNGIPVDALARAYKAGTKELVSMARTYRDTGSMYLVPGIYDLEVTPLEDSDVMPLLVAGLESKANETVHQTISFDGAKFLVMAKNNEEGWDTMVKIFPTGSKKASSGGRTYGREDTYELNSGMYDIELTALVIKGPQIFHRIDSVQIGAGETKKIAHTFQSGEAKIGVVSGEELVDAVVKVTDPGTKKVEASSRTYTAPNNNPRSFILTPGTYEISVMSLGKHAGYSETFSLEVKAGETVEKILSIK
ncbi:VWA domain-containing protein [Echinicola sp. CAU 1574]|uniref:VWA domain-containing protein n=1 Tax=Echinicola arenosa TaxID=2774144 RepID=A0ABR9AQG6_9BACT|nr:VWA domain-containing protein [Echinicola arenosa]MBD8491023.1 VWA domain-containing protein [Echinicola arenosa]